MTAEQYDGLKASIVERGVLSPIVVSAGPACKGEIGDGHHRKRACEELMIDCPQELRGFETEAEFRIFQIVTNLERRELTKVQRAEMAMALEPWERKQAAERKSAHGGTAPGRPSNTAAQMGTSVVVPEWRSRTRQVVAAAVGLKPSTYQRISDVLKSDEEDLKDALRAEEITPSAAQKALLQRKRLAAGDPLPLSQPAHMSAALQGQALRDRNKKRKEQADVLLHGVIALQGTVARFEIHGLMDEDDLHEVVTSDIAVARAKELTEVIQSLGRLRKKLNERMNP
jgi:ParB-like chromosome segregation protein Spo0J